MTYTAAEYRLTSRNDVSHRGGVLGILEVPTNKCESFLRATPYSNETRTNYHFECIFEYV